LLDGFPRTILQAKMLENIADIDCVLRFMVTEKEILARLSGRIICRSCGAIFNINFLPTKKSGICDKCGGEVYQRDDDKEEVIKQRLKTYNEQTKPLIKYFDEKGILYEIEANLRITDPKAHIIEDCFEVLDNIKSQTVKLEDVKSDSESKDAKPKKTTKAVKAKK
jgi:adenylate kinase